MNLPSPLFPGARVALVAPSGPVPPERLGPAVCSVEELDLQPIVLDSCRTARGYLAGEDELRAEDLNAAFADPSVDGIWCIRGGYGAQRILPQIKFDLIRRNPKVFAGYSDITALHVAIQQRCGLVTYHTPMPSTELCFHPDEFTLRSLRTALFGPEQTELENPAGMPLVTLAGGSAKGILTGGNLSLVSSSLGTPYEIDSRGKILFLEDVDEEPYRIDRMLTQLKLAGKLDDCAGILLGYWTNCIAKEPEKSLTLEQVLRDLLPEGKPVLANLACGHSLPSLSLPLGKTVALNADARQIIICG